MQHSVETISYGNVLADKHAAEVPQQQRRAAPQPLTRNERRNLARRFTKNLNKLNRILTQMKDEHTDSQVLRCLSAAATEITAEMRRIDAMMYKR